MVLLEIRKKLQFGVCSHGAVHSLSCVQLFATMVSPCKFPHSKGRITIYRVKKKVGRNVENSHDNSLAESFFRKGEEPVFFLLISALVSGIENSPVWSPKSISLRSQLITFFFFYKTKYVFLKDLGDIHLKCSHQRKQLPCLLVTVVSQEPNFHKQHLTNIDYLIKPSHHLLGSPVLFYRLISMLSNSPVFWFMGAEFNLCPLLWLFWIKPFLPILFSGTFTLWHYSGLPLSLIL